MAAKPKPLGPTSREVILQAHESLMALMLVARERGTLSKSECPEDLRGLIGVTAFNLAGMLNRLVITLPEFHDDQQ